MTADAPRPLVEELERHAAERPGDVCLTTPGAELRLRDLVAAAHGVAARLRADGVRRGDRVALVARNGADLVTAYFGTHAAGAVAVPLGPDAGADGLAAALQLAHPALVLADAETPDVGARRADLGAYVAAGRDAGASGGSDARPDEPADLLFTTGTSGTPKGVLLTHRNIAAAARNINAFVGAGPDDVEVCPLPLGHSFGLGRLRCMARVGHRLVVDPGMRNPAQVWQRLATLRATGLALVPAGLALLRRVLGARLADLASHVRYVEIGSAPLAAPERDWLLEHLPHTRLCHHYGLTEASRAAFRELRADAATPDAVGRASPGVEIRVASDDGTCAPHGTPGEIEVRGDVVMLGYFERDDLTRAAFHDGWLRTGDLGTLDAAGNVRLLGRKGDVVNVGGLKVSPESVESALREHPQVRDAGCVGAPDPRGVLGEHVRAFLVCDADVAADELTAWLRGRLAEHQVPREYVRVAELPRTASGKLRRQVLRDAPPPALGALR